MVGTRGRDFMAALRWSSCDGPEVKLTQWPRGRAHLVSSWGQSRVRGPAWGVFEASELRPRVRNSRQKTRMRALLLRPHSEGAPQVRGPTWGFKAKAPCGGPRGRDPTRNLEAEALPRGLEGH
ncbi:hypothetical protein TIFTF001_034292 [Ficus carica]|uniref:Uncharacterized protein n=1 Tax=Ficus carica TaxID=3494 RepID=A0AA88E006_FICCA|nr:hypothetical protein TIFTF001_034292 [Ficus carica]